MNIDQIGKVLSSGFLAQFGPQMASGFLSEWAKKLKTKEVIEWVKNNESLWSHIEPKFQGKLKALAPKMKNIEWVTTEWAIMSIREANSGLASLFLNWPEARKYLEEQVLDLRKNIFDKGGDVQMEPFRIPNDPNMNDQGVTELTALTSDAELAMNPEPESATIIEGANVGENI